MADGRIIIDTEIDNSGAEKGVKQLDKIASAALKGVGVAVAGVATAVGGLSMAAIKVGSDFEEGMSKVQAISGATGKELEELTEKAKEMGAKTKFSAGESAQAFQYMAMAGWKTGDMLNGIEGIMNLAAASGEDLAMVSDIVTDALTAFGLQAKDSAHFADVLAKASSNSNTNVGLMGYTFQYVAPVAGALKYSIEDCAVAIGLMANAGIKGEKSGTALRTLFTNLVKPTDEVSESMKRLSIEAINADGTMKPLNQLLLEMRSSFSGLTDEQKASEAAALAGKEAMSGLLAIVNASDEDFNNLTAAIADSNGAAEEMATIMQDNLSGKLEQLGGGLETLGLTAYAKFQGPMKDAIDTAIEAVDSLVISLNDKELGESVDRIAEGFGNLTTKLAEIMAAGLPMLIEGFTWILNNGKGIAVIIGTIGASVAAFKAAAVITKVVQSWQEAKVALALYKMTAEGATISQGVMNGVFTVWETIVALITGKISLATAVTGLWSKAVAVLNAMWAANPIGIVIVAITALIGAIIYLWNTNEGFREAIINCWNAIKEVGISVWEWLVNFFTVDIPNAWNTVVEFFQGIPDWFAELWAQVTAKFQEWGTNISNFFTETIPQWIENITNWFNELPYKIGYALGYVLATIAQWGVNTWNYFTTNIPIWIESITNWFSELPGRIWTWLVATYNKVVAWGTDMYNKAIESAKNFIDGVISWISQLPEKISVWLRQTIDKLINFASDAYAKARDAGKKIIDGIVSTIKNLPDQIYDIGVNIVEGLWNGITSMGTWIKNKVSSFFSGIVDGAKSVLGIHSPSRVFRDQVGKYMAEGVGVGFEDESDNVRKSMERDLSDLVAKMKGTVDYETTMTTARVVSHNNNLSGGVEESDTKSGKQVIENHIHVDIEGKEVAYAIAPYQDILAEYDEGR